MSKMTLTKPILIMMYGFPGAGKTHFARQMCKNIQAAHISSDRIRGGLFEKPRYDKEENQVVEHLMLYMAEEFLAAGISVIYDTSLTTYSSRRKLRDLAKKAHAGHMLVWFQIDHDTAFARVMARDRRKIDDKYARGFDRTSFDAHITAMQNPRAEENFIVLSGKHSFSMQRSTLVRHLYSLNLVNAASTSANVIKPGMVNLIPDRGDIARRNIRIR